LSNGIGDIFFAMPSLGIFLRSFLSCFALQFSPKGALAQRHFSATVLALPNGIKNAMALYRFNVKRGTGIEDAKRAIAFRKGYLDTKLKDSFAVSNLTK